MALKYDEEDKKRVFALNEKKMSIDEISKILQISRHTIWRWLNNYHEVPRYYKGERLRSLFEIVKTKTLNFERIIPKVFIENSHYSIVFRYMFGLSENELCEKIGMTRSKLLNFLSKQTLNSKNQFDKEFCQKISEFFNQQVKEHPEVKNWGFYELNDKRKHIYKCRKPPKNFIDYHYIQSKLPLNDSEKQIASILNENNIQYKTHYFIKAFSREINVDFLIENDNSTYIIEVGKNFIRSPRKDSNTEVKLRAIDHKFCDIKKINPTIKCILVYFTNKNINKKMFLFADNVFIQPDLDENIKNFLSNLNDENAKIWNN